MRLRVAMMMALCLILLRGGYAQQATKMTLQDAITYALQNSNALKIAKRNITDADLLLKENKATGLPQVDASLSLQHFIQRPALPSSALGFGNFGAAFEPIYSGLWAAQDKLGLSRTQPPAPDPDDDGRIAFNLKNNFTGSITASQLIFSGSYTVALRAAAFYKDLVNIELAAKQDSVRDAVTMAYLPALLIDESVRTLDKNISNLEKTIAEVRATYKAGFIEQLDVDRLELSVNNLRFTRENLLRQRNIPLNALKLSINYPLDQPLDLSDDINTLLQPVSDADMVAVVDYKSRREMRVLDATERLLNLNVELAKSAKLPTVAGFASYQYGLQGNSFNNLFGVPAALVGVTANYNIWDSYQRKTKIERAQLALEQFRTTKSDVERFINFEVTNARTAIETAQKNLDNQQKNLALAEKIYAVTQKKYKEGVGSSLELTTAERDIYQAQSNVRQAQYDLLVAQRQLKKALGKN